MGNSSLGLMDSNQIDHLVHSDIRLDHLSGIDDAIEFGRADGAELERGLSVRS
jgi:hypothetical protein